MEPYVESCPCDGVTNAYYQLDDHSWIVTEAECSPDDEFSSRAGHEIVMARMKSALESLDMTLDWVQPVHFAGFGEPTSCGMPYYNEIECTILTERVTCPHCLKILAQPAIEAGYRVERQLLRAETRVKWSMILEARDDLDKIADLAEAHPEWFDERNVRRALYLEGDDDEYEENPF